MNRLLQGEVGSGKTLVALRAMLRVVDSGGQAALLAPTEVLAQQHYRSITAMLGDLAAGGMLGGAADGTTRRAADRLDAQGRTRRGDVADGDAARPASSSAPTRCSRRRCMFADLGLVVVDEQHRFGVEQRAALTDKAGLAAPRAGDDRDPDPAHGGDDGLRRPRGVHARRAARRPRPDPDQRRAARRAPRLDRPRLGAGPRGGRQGPPGLRRVPADHRRRARGGRDRRRHRARRGRSYVDAPVPASAERPLPRRRRGRRGAAPVGPARRQPRRDAARQDAARRQGPRDARVRRGRDRRTRRHHRHRGRRRRRQRDHDGAARRRPVRHLPAPPDARPGRPRRAARAVPAGHPRRARHPGARAARCRGRHHRRLRAQPARPRPAPRGRRPRRFAVAASGPA